MTRLTIQIHHGYQTVSMRNDGKSMTGNCFFCVGRSRTSGQQQKIALDLEKINVSQQVIDQQPILLKILVSSNTCIVVAWRCRPIETYPTLFLVLSSQQGKAQQTMCTCTQEPTYFACVFEEPSCYCRQVLHQRASQAVSMYVLRHADSFTIGVKRPVAINCKTKRYMWRCAFPCNHQMDGVNSFLENHCSCTNRSAGCKPADQKENDADS